MYYFKKYIIVYSNVLFLQNKVIVGKTARIIMDGIIYITLKAN